MAEVLIGYFSKSGHTKAMATAIKTGLDSIDGLGTVFKTVQEITVEDLISADGIILGSPTYFGTMATEVKDLLDRSIKCYGKLIGKAGGAFASSGQMGGGNETTIMSIIQGLMIHGMIIQGVMNGNHYGPVAFGAPDEAARQECIQYGEMVGQLVRKLS